MTRARANRTGRVSTSISIAAACWVASSCTTEFDPKLLARSSGDAGAAETSVLPTPGAGCSDGTTLLPGDDPKACGRDGATCRACSAAAPFCAAGRCVIDRGAMKLSAAGTVSAFVDRQGGVWTFGSNRQGQLGSGAPGSDGRPPTPVQPSGFRDVAVGADYDSHGCAIGVDGRLVCWGSNGNAESGAPRSTGFLLTPTRVGDATDWRAVAAGAAFSCGIRGEGRLACWGWNGAGRLGVVAPDYSPDPIEPSTRTDWAAVSAGDDSACALTADGRAHCWGSGEGGTLGGAAPAPGPAPIASDVQFARISVGTGHACAVGRDGALWCWGNGSAGQLGIAGSTPVPARVETENTWREIAGGGAHTCAIKRDGSLWCWGDGAKGQLGLDQVASASSPTRVGERTDWALVAAGPQHTCGVVDDGSVFCWGDNAEGQSGLPGGSSTARVPTRVAP